MKQIKDENYNGLVKSFTEYEKIEAEKNRIYGSYMDTAEDESEAVE